MNILPSQKHPSLARISPAFAGRHGCQAVEECVAGILRSLGEGGHALVGFAEDTRGATVVNPWGFTRGAAQLQHRRGIRITGIVKSRSSQDKSLGLGFDMI